VPRQSTKAETWEAACSALKRYNRPEEKPVRRITPSAAIEQWLTEEVEPNNRESTQKLYRIAAGELVVFLTKSGLTYVDEVTVDRILELRAEWLARGLKRSTINAYRTYLNIWLAYCVLRGWMKENPVAKVKALKKKSTDDEPTLPLDSEGDANWQLVHRSLVPFLERRDSRSERSIQQHPQHFLALIELLYHTGLRISDALFFDPRRIVDTPHGGSYTTRQIKNDHDVTVFLETWLVQKLRSLTPLGDYLFFDGGDWQYYINCHIRNPLAALGRELGFAASLRPHRFRDSFAVNSLNQGVAISDLKDLLGHKSIATTEKYYLPWVRSRQVALEKRLYATRNGGLRIVPISA
jgi:site-specific recombinase XerD